MQLAACAPSDMPPSAKPHLPKQEYQRETSQIPKIYGGIAHSTHYTELSHKDAISFLERKTHKENHLIILSKQ